MARRSTTIEGPAQEFANSDLMIAVWASDLPTVQKLVHSGVPQELLDISLVAAVHASPQILKLLLRVGADPNYNEGKALNLAVRRKNHTATVLLLSYGARAEFISPGLLMDTVRYNTLGLVSTLLASHSELPPQDRKFVEMLVNLHSEAKYLACDLPEELILDVRRRNLMCDAITGCLMRGEESKVRALVTAYASNEAALAALLECVAARDHLCPAFGRIRDLLLKALDKLAAS